MSETSNGPVRYRVIYSERVRNGLKKLAAIATERGLAPQLLAALKEMDQRLRIYPQFGQPLRDPKLKPARLWLGVVPPLVVHYLLDEQRRLVMVISPILPLPRSGF